MEIPLGTTSLEKVKACILSRDGRLLWRSPAWLGRRDRRAEQRLLGNGWHEFIVARDLPRVLDWLRGEGEAISLCCLDPESGEPRRLAWAKVGYGAHWLIVGDVDECQECDPCAHRELPAPPCLCGDGGGADD
jgi:hypothetical protein